MAVVEPGPGEVVEVLLGLGYTPDVSPHGVATWGTEIIFGDFALAVFGVAAPDGDGVALELHCPVVFADLDRLADVDLPGPIAELDFDEDEADGVEYEENQLWLIARASVARGTVGVAIERFVASVSEALSDWARAGRIRVVDCVELDPSLKQMEQDLVKLKATNPHKALDLARELAERCREYGDHYMGAAFDLAAAEVAADLGRVHVCWELADRSWEVLGRRYSDADFVASYIGSLVAMDRCEDALEVLERAEREAEDAAGVAQARGNRGVLLGHCSRNPEAIRLLESALADPAYPEQFRTQMEAQLRSLREQIGGRMGEPPPPSDDVLDEADRRLNLAAAQLLSVQSTARSLSEVAAQAPEIQEVADWVRERWSLVGPSQQARVHMLDGVVALLRDDRRAARIHLRASIRTATDAGEMTIARWATHLAAANGLDPGGPVGELVGIERVMYHLASARNELLSAGTRGVDVAGAGERALASALEAVRAIDEDRPQFGAIVDRGSWATLGARAYELALAIAVMFKREDLAVELLERVRAQGLPAEVPPVQAALALDGNESAPARAVVEAALDQLVVDTPCIATVTGVSEVDPDTEAITIAELAASVAGEDAWWWSCHTIGTRLYWSVRSPDGVVSAGMKINEGEGAPDLSALAALFSAPASETEFAEHILVEDRRARLEKVLRYLAEFLVPPPIADAVRRAARSGTPIRVAWAAPPAFASVPVALLPLDGEHRLIHGAVITIAPPSSLARLLPTSEVPTGAEELVVLGGGNDLTQASRLVGRYGLGTPARRVLGTAVHLAARPPLAAALATPESVLARWVEAPLVVYYGHVRGDDKSPLSTRLALSNGPGSTGPDLDVERLLVPQRRGAPQVVVLCGCSSLEPSTMGSGEWWGFGVGLLWQGSRQVIGSVWHLLDTESTVEFAAQLVSRLAGGDDPAAALRELQLQWMADWKDARHEPVTYSADDRHPIIWAGWAVTGFCGQSTKAGR